jgi:hypothetical protein
MQHVNKGLLLYSLVKKWKNVSLKKAIRCPNSLVQYSKPEGEKII